MRRVLAILALAVLLAGCSKPAAPPAASTPPPSFAPPSSDATPTPSTPAPTPTPTPTPKPTAPTPTPTTPTPTPAPLPAHDNYSASRSGWVVPPQDDPSTFTVRFTFLAYAGGNVTATASLTTITPLGVAPAPHPTVRNLTLLDPEGKVAYWTNSTSDATSAGTNQTLRSNASAPLEPGEWTLSYTVIGGASDGSSAGDEYQVSVAVRY